MYMNLGIRNHAGGCGVETALTSSLPPARHRVPRGFRADGVGAGLTRRAHEL
jgi:hypothetical protein